MRNPYFFSRKVISPIFTHPIYFGIGFLLTVVLAFLTQYAQNELYEWVMPSFVTFCLLLLITPWVARYLFRTFSSLQDTVTSLTETNSREWFQQQKHFIFGLNPWSVLTTVFLLLIGESTNYYMAWGALSGFARMVYFLQMGFLFAMLGSLGWAFGAILLFAYRLRTLNFDPEPFETKKNEFDTFNSSFLRIFGAGVVLYVGSVVAGWLGIGSVMLAIPVIRFWVFPLALAVIGFFVCIQLFLHEIMKKSKKIRVNKILLLVRNHYRIWEREQSSDEIAVINNLLTWKEKIEKETEWPFDVLTVVSIIVSVLLPAARSIIELF